jgi:hypothetical protein
MPTQAAIHAGARHFGTEKLPHHGQQVIQRQQKVPAQIDGNRFLPAVHCRLQTMCRMRAIQRVSTVLPLRAVQRPMLYRRASVLIPSPLAASSARTAGVVRAFLCKWSFIFLSFLLFQRNGHLPQYLTRKKQRPARKLY